MSQIDERDLEWFEGASFAGHVGPQDAETIRKLVATYRAAYVYLKALDARRVGHGCGTELVAEVELRNAVRSPVSDERIIAAIREIGRDRSPSPDFQERVWQRIACRNQLRRPWWRRLWSKISW